MKLFQTSFAVVLALTVCETKADKELRKRPHQFGGGREGGEGGGGKLGGRLEAMIETQCSDDAATTAYCADVDLEELDCTFQNEPAPPVTAGMDVDTRAQARREYKKACNENMVKCACCEGMTVEEILAARGDAGGSGRPFGGGRPGRPGRGEEGGGMMGLFDGGSGGGGRLQSMIETQCNDPTTCDGVDGTSLECTFEPLVRPDMSTLDLNDEQGLAQAKEDFKAQMEDRRQDMVKCACCGTMSIEEVLAAARPLGGSGGRPGGRPGGMGGGGGMNIEERLEAMCNEDDAEQKCTDIASQAQAMDCTKFDSMMSNLDSMLDTNTRGGRKGRRKNMFYCGCCRGSD